MRVVWPKPHTFIMTPVRLNYYSNDDGTNYKITQ